VTRVAIDAGKVLASVACPSAGLCVAVDREGRAVVGDPRAQGRWTVAAIAGMSALSSVSCSSSSQCVAVDDVGQAAVGAGR